MNKQALREEMKKKRREFSGKEEASKKACENILSMTEYKKARCVLVYMSCFGEVLTKSIIEDAKKEGKKVLVPITDVKTNTLRISYLEGEMKKGAYGIPEPENEKEASLSEIDFIVVPGICFDKNGNRIGFGKGYYDRLLKETKAFKAGLCYDFQIADNIDADEFDIKMDAIVTESGVLRVDKEENK